MIGGKNRPFNPVAGRIHTQSQSQKHAVPV